MSCKIRDECSKTTRSMVDELRYLFLEHEQRLKEEKVFPGIIDDIAQEKDERHIGDFVPSSRMDTSLTQSAPGPSDVTQTRAIARNTCFGFFVIRIVRWSG